MQAFEVTGAIDSTGQLTLDQPLQHTYASRARVIVLLSEDEPVDSHRHEANSPEAQECSAQSFLGMIDQIRAQVPPEEWQKLPTDLAKNVDHYLYGFPKVEE